MFEIGQTALHLKVDKYSSGLSMLWQSEVKEQ